MELIDVLDENGVKTGEVVSREEVHKKGLWHRAIYNVPISVDTIRRRYPIKWTYQEGIESLIVDTKIWVF